MATVRQLVERELRDISSSVSTDPTQTLDKIDQVVVAVNFLDSVVRLPEDVYGDILAARRILENLSSTSVRTPQINSNTLGRQLTDALLLYGNICKNTKGKNRSDGDFYVEKRKKIKTKAKFTVASCTTSVLRTMWQGSPSLLSPSFLWCVLQLRCLRKYPHAIIQQNPRNQQQQQLTVSIFSRVCVGSVDTLLLMFRNSLSTSWRRAATGKESAIWI